MNRLLIITVIDIERQPNNRDHHLIPYFSARCRETVVAYKRKLAAGSALRMIKDMLVPSSRCFVRDGVRYLDINPLLNHYPGLSRDLTKARPVATGGGPKPWRSRLLSIVTSLALLKDALFVPSFLPHCLFRTSGRFDVCVAIGPRAGLVAYLMKILGRVRCLVYEDVDYEPGLVVPRVRQLLLAKLETYLMKRADLVVSVGRALAQLRRDQAARDVFIVSNGVNVEAFRPARERSSDAPTLVYSGNVTYWSGLDVVISALPEIARTIPHVRLTIIGGGITSYLSQRQALVTQKGVGDRVTFLGTRSNDSLPAAFRKADVGLAFFVPMDMRRYAVPLKVFEYIAAGLPVIGTKGSETETILNEGRCGIAVDYDAASFAAAAKALLGDPDVYREYSRNAVAHSETLDWSVLLEKEERLIRGALRALEPGGAS